MHHGSRRSPKFEYAAPDNIGAVFFHGEWQMKIAILPGDGIGPEIVGEAMKVLDVLRAEGMALATDTAPIGGAGYDAARHPLPPATLKLAQESDAVLMGAVGGPRYDALPRELRPEQGILGIRKALGLFANLRPAFLYPELAGASTLKAEVVAGLDIMILRELTGDIYFGQPRGRRRNAAGDDEGFDTMLYSVPEIRRIARLGFETARRRNRRLTSVDKANVLDTSILWREVVSAMAADYPDVTLSHMYVDNAAMQLLRNPKQFDVIVTGNIFGDILSDEASMLAGSIGMLPSASLDANQKGLYEPIHGSAPDIAGQDKANPLATILSLAMMFQYTFARPDVAQRIEGAVRRVLQQGHRTGDIALPGEKVIGTRAMGAAVVAALRSA
jgi:3-isopropylmalate dehydrogenase